MLLLIYSFFRYICTRFHYLLSLDNDVLETSKRRAMFYNILSQNFIVKCFTKSLLIRIILLLDIIFVWLCFRLLLFSSLALGVEHLLQWNCSNSKIIILTENSHTMTLTDRGSWNPELHVTNAKSVLLSRAKISRNRPLLRSSKRLFS